MTTKGIASDAPRPKRKAIPDKVKHEVRIRQMGRCKVCGGKLQELTCTEFDHRPALINRRIAEDKKDYDPPQLDPNFIEALCSDCHDKRTNGPGGEKRITTAGSDIGIRDKTRRLIAKGKPREASPLKGKPKAQIQSAGFPKRDKPQARATGFKRRGV